MSKKVNKEPSLAERAAAEQAAKDEKTATNIQNTEAGNIWNEIKDKSIEMFALPDQTVSMHVHPVEIEPSKLYVLLTSTAVLPSLETALGKKYIVELVDKYCTVARAPVPPTAKR